MDKSKNEIVIPEEIVMNKIYETGMKKLCLTWIYLSYMA